MSAENREVAKLKTKVSKLEERIEELETIITKVRREANTPNPPTRYG